MLQPKIRISQVQDLPGGFFEALGRWRVEAERILNSDEIKRYAKYAHTNFVFDDVEYTVELEDVCTKEAMEAHPYCLDAGFEILQNMIKKDLVNLGAEKITNISFLD